MTLLKLTVAAAIAAISIFGIVNSRMSALSVSASAQGPSASHTNAPGENNCTECHIDFPLNSGDGSVLITGIPAKYLPGQQVPVTVKTSDPSVSVSEFGFQMTAIDNFGRKTGSYTLPQSSPAKMQVISGSVGGNQRDYVEHTVDGLYTQGVFNSNSWSFTWTAPAQPMGRIGFYAAGNAANGNGQPSGDYIYSTSRFALPRTPTTLFDFDGDGKTDISIFRPGPGEWWYLRSSDGGNFATQFGTSTDKVVAADYTGDGKDDIAFWRPSTGQWFVLRSEDSSFYSFPFGSNGDIPMPADYDGDGKADPAVYRPANSTWYINNSSGGTTIQQFGATGDQPIAADFTGDGKADLAVFRPNGTNGAEWWIAKSSGGIFATQFGSSTDKAVPADYTGDGKADVAFWRPSTGVWYILRSEDSSYFAFPFGGSGDVPVPGDYDGDGKVDAAVFRPSTSTWFASRSTSGVLIQQFGIAGDQAVPNAYVR